MSTPVPAALGARDQSMSSTPARTWCPMGCPIRLGGSSSQITLMYDIHRIELVHKIADRSSPRFCASSHQSAYVIPCRPSLTQPSFIASTPDTLRSRNSTAKFLWAEGPLMISARKRLRIPQDNSPALSQLCCLLTSCTSPSHLAASF